PDLGLKMLRERIELDVAPAFFHFLCGKSLEASRDEPERGVELMATALGFLRASAKQVGSDFPALEALGIARLGNTR
ncbi:MAG: hypothetical protein GWN84_07325, partial [Gammaproteobacteria bacterium]|nr:hypothetical protein [Gammaproteobacteria bacterium]NIU03846.1 hypothetical protein [Gammaproteobacteria bacterium]NIV51180.1 hypothetical protein [Gammaproteobacteria bacterium]NIX85120.1 hypothetical protein [Gammaproteobacteria bacterium]